MRPTSLENYVGQKHLVSDGEVLHQAIQSANLPSIIFWGPPGVGKTTLAKIISHELNRPFYSLSAIDAGVKEVRQVIQLAKKQDGVILFIDEIHRFNKAQQDALLAAVESGTITLIGATTENPSFEVVTPLLSRCQVYVLEPLSREELIELVQNSLKDDEVLKEKKIEIQEYDALLRLSGGDGRKLLNLIELLTVNQNAVVVTNELVQKQAKQKMAMYDKNGEMHYDIISAFIKSIRGSDPNAATYYLARMISGGEDPKFIARRLLILASEDIGNANPTALVLANSCFQAVNVIGYPECQLILSQTTIYLACSAKSNSATTAIGQAMSAVKKHGDLSIPLPIRNAPTKLMKSLDYGKDYQYAHGYDGNFVDMEFLPEEISGHTFYQPGENARENEMRTFLRKNWREKYGY